MTRASIIEGCTALNGRSAEEEKPGMVSNRREAGLTPLRDAAVAPCQGLCPVDPVRPSGRVLRKILGIRLTASLRQQLAARAAQDGISDSALVRRLIADLVGDDAPIDRESGSRSVLKVPAADLAAASVLLGTLTKLILVSRELQDGQASGAIAAMESVHGRLVRLVQKAEG